MLNRTDAAGSNDRNIDRFADRACQRQIETLLGAVPVHAGQQNLACAAPLHFDSPFHRVQTGRITSAVGKDFPTGVFRVDRFGIDSNDNRLRTKKTGRFVYQLRIGYSGRIDAGLIGTGIEQAADIGNRTHTAADG